MPATTAQKLTIKAGFTLRTLHAPKDFENELGDLPPEVRISSTAKTFDQLHWFVETKAQADEEADGVIKLLQEGVTLWTYFPKGSSKLQTDLTRDQGWESLLKHKNLQWLRLVSFNDTWSAFAMRLKTGADQKKQATPKERPINQYIDAANKTVFLPNDFSEALERAPGEKAFFNTLSFTNKKEYVEWIVSAKREETRQTRVQESVSRLAKGWKNPSNR